MLKGLVMGALIQVLLARCLQGFSGLGIARQILLLVGGLLLALAVWGWARGGRADAVLARLETGLVGAGVRNASDAVATVQARANSEKAMEGRVIDAQSAIMAASDMAGADAAGRDGLCAISAGFCASSRMQQPDPR